MKDRIKDDRITLDYGSGGLKTSELIESILLPAFDNTALSQLGDGAILGGSDKLVFSTDSFVVSPWEFPGGDIGKTVCLRYSKRSVYDRRDSEIPQSFFYIRRRILFLRL